MRHEIITGGNKQNAVVMYAKYPASETTTWGLSILALNCLGGKRNPNSYSKCEETPPKLKYRYYMKLFIRVNYYNLKLNGHISGHKYMAASDFGGGIIFYIAVWNRNIKLLLNWSSSTQMSKFILKIVWALDCKITL